MEILKIEDLSFTYPLCSEPSVKNVSFSVEKGEFILLCGATGSGKSTLLRTIKRELTPNGKLTGRVMFSGTDVRDLDPKESASAIGFVMQDPEHQIVTDKVWHELAFGLENLGTPQPEIQRRIAETAGCFGLDGIFDKDASELSGGQQQLVCLASVLAMAPRLLILDEPTAQLDPIAATELLNTVRRLCTDYGMTVIMTEHRLEEAAVLCDRLIVMENGAIIIDAPPEKAVSQLSGRPDILLGMPAAARIFIELGAKGVCPLTVRDGRRFIEEHCGSGQSSLPEKPFTHSDKIALECRELFFRYEKGSPDVLSDLDLTVYEGELFCILGGNGSGKSSFLKAIAGLVKPYSGKIRVFGTPLNKYKGQSLYRSCLTMLPQDVKTVFLKNTVREELAECGADPSALPYDLSQLMDKHPYDLSGGQQQLVALAKALAAKPRLLLLDEPTKGLDAAAKAQITGILRRLTEEGVTVIVVTHDVEFAAVYSDRCALFFDGKALAPDTPRRFFPQNSFFTTAVCRMTRDRFTNAVTVDDAVTLCRPDRTKGDFLC